MIIIKSGVTMDTSLRKVGLHVQRLNASKDNAAKYESGLLYRRIGLSPSTWMKLSWRFMSRCKSLTISPFEILFRRGQDSYQDPVN